MFKKLLAALALIGLFIGVYLFKFQRPSISSENILIVGTNAEFPPFCFVENGIITGFDIDLIKAIAHKIKKKIIIKDMPFDALLSSLQTGNIQVIAAGMTPTPERAERIEFTDIYFEGDPLVIVSRKNQELKTVEELTGKKVAVNDGYTADLYMSAITGLELIRLPTPADALLALKNRNVDAYVSAKTPIAAFFKTQDHALVSTIIPNTSESSAFGVTKTNETLLKQINEALAIIKQDGSLTSLKQQWNL